jgi:hypothetical protein
MRNQSVVRTWVCGRGASKVEEYRAHAAECLSLSRKTQSEVEKRQLVEMAKVWETLALYRESEKRAD